MRLSVIKPAELAPEQQSFYEDMRAGIAQNFKGFTAIGDDGALPGHSTHGCMSRSSVGRSGSW